MRLTSHGLPWLALLAILTACSSVKLQTVTPYRGPALPKPDRVLVADFVVSADDVSLNRGLFARLGHQISGTPASVEQLKIARDVSTALSVELVKRITALGLTAERIAGETAPDARSAIIEGQFVSVDEGNRLQRVVIGFGAGASVVKTTSQVWVGTPGGPVLAETFTSEAKSAPTPGMGPMVGIGGTVAGTAAVAAATSGGVQAATEHSRTVVADTQHTADALAKQLAQFFVSQGWIPPSSVK